jgi:hypothetical protein
MSIRDPFPSKNYISCGALREKHNEGLWAASGNVELIPQEIEVVTNNLRHFFLRDHFQRSLLSDEKCMASEHLSALLDLVSGPHKLLHHSQTMPRVTREINNLGKALVGFRPRPIPDPPSMFIGGAFERHPLQHVSAQGKAMGLTGRDLSLSGARFCV